MSVELHDKPTMDRDRHYNATALKVYVSNTALHKLADRWLTENNILDMAVPSKAWSMIVRHLNKVIEKKLADYFEVPASDCKWSRKCGCSCGCSPGFNIKDTPYSYCSVRAKVGITSDEIAEFQKLIVSSKLKRKLDEDWVKHEIKIEPCAA
jgi:hypothetical protein